MKNIILRSATCALFATSMFLADCKQANADNRSHVRRLARLLQQVEAAHHHSGVRNDVGHPSSGLTQAAAIEHALKLYKQQRYELAAELVKWMFEHYDFITTQGEQIEQQSDTHKAVNGAIAKIQNKRFFEDARKGAIRTPMTVALVTPSNELNNKQRADIHKANALVMLDAALETLQQETGEEVSSFGKAFALRYFVGDWKSADRLLFFLEKNIALPQGYIEDSPSRKTLFNMLEIYSAIAALEPGGSFTIGRDSDDANPGTPFPSYLNLTVSRNAATVTKRRDGNIVLVVPDGKKVTVNGMQYTGPYSKDLGDGDSIQFGTAVILVFWSDIEQVLRLAKSSGANEDNDRSSTNNKSPF